MLATFYPDILPSEGSYAIFLGATKQHIWCASIDELIRKTEEQGDDRSIYFAVSSFQEPTTRSASNALFSRAFYFDIDAGPEKFFKHGDKVYPTQKAALAALVAWCKTSGMVPTYVVSSGAGLHVYFCLDADTPIAEWKPVADALKRKALAEGLRIDAAVTGDAARILRPAGTLHPSGERVKVLRALPVRYSLSNMSALVAAHMERPVAKRERRLIDDVIGVPVGPPKSVVKIASRCAAMNEAMSSKGDVSEPYWRAMLGVIKFTVEGAEAAHTFSEGHDDYDHATTQDKYDRWTAGPSTCTTFEAENPQACATCAFKGKVKSPIMLGELTPPEVAKLPQAEPAAEVAVEAQPFADDTSDDFEERAVRIPRATAPWEGYIPEKFKIVQVGKEFAMTWRHVVKQENEAGDMVNMEITTAFAAVPFWFESWAAGSNDNDQAMAIYCVYDIQRDRVDRYTLPTRNVAKRDSLFGCLAAQNIQVYPTSNHSKNAMEEFVKASLERIRAAGQRQKIAERFGTMYDAHGNVIVAQGAHMIASDGTIIEGVVHEKLRARGSAYCVPVPRDARGTWGPEVWASDILPKAQRHIKYLDEFYSEDNFSPYQLAIMLAWASPMLAYMQGTFRPGMPLPGIGLTVSLYSPISGIGKTAAMHAAALAFGIPSAVCLQLDRNNSTDNARQALVLQSGTMPSFMDEMEDVDPKDLAGLISAVGNGSSKSRMTKELSVTGGVTTALVNIMSTNKSHRELVAADRVESAAVQMRMLEIECSAVAAVSSERALQETEARSRLHDCAGAVGAIIHYSMARAGADNLNRLGIECADKARAMLAGRQDGRFMWRALGAMLAVRRMLKGAGLQVFSGDNLVAEFKKWHDHGYEFASERLVPTGAGAQMAMFLSDMAGNTLITKGESHRSGGHDSLADVPLNDRTPDPVVARSVLDGRYVYVKSDALRDWCTKRRLGFNGLVAKCRAEGVIEPPNPDKPSTLTRKIDLFKGTKLAQGVRSQVFKVLVRELSADMVLGGKSGEIVNLFPAAVPAAVPAIEQTS